MNPYVGYEYMEVTVPARDASLWLDSYASFGWHPDENRPAPGSGVRVTLFLKRDRRLVNRTELTRLQRHFEACMAEIDRLHRAPVRAAALRALTVGLLGTACMAGSVFAVTHDPPCYLLMTMLAVPGFLGWAAPGLLYARWVRRRQDQLRSALDAQYEEVDRLCEKGHALL